MKRNEKKLARAFVTSLEGSTKSQIENAAKDLIKMLAGRNELHRVKGMVDAIEDVWRERYGAATITIQTTHPLSAVLRKKLGTLAPGAQLKEIVRPEIIGGAKLRIDETIIDGSIEGHLAQLNQAFRNA